MSVSSVQSSAYTSSPSLGSFVTSVQVPKAGEVSYDRDLRFFVNGDEISVQLWGKVGGDASSSARDIRSVSSPICWGNISGTSIQFKDHNGTDLGTYKQLSNYIKNNLKAKLDDATIEPNARRNGDIGTITVVFNK